MHVVQRQVLQAKEPRAVDVLVDVDAERRFAIERLEGGAALQAQTDRAVAAPIVDEVRLGVGARIGQQRGDRVGSDDEADLRDGVVAEDLLAQVARRRDRLRRIRRDVGRFRLADTGGVGLAR